MNDTTLAKDIRDWLKVHTLAAEYKYETNTNQYVMGYICACENIQAHINSLLNLCLETEDEDSA